ncbi:MAG: sugar ABC transporter permease [Clostridiales bacterium]|nr:sugar ABC transporter permease [Clostridiales bacterium]
MLKNTLVTKKEIEQLKLLPFAMIPVIFLSLMPIVRGIYAGFTDHVLGSEISFNWLENYRIMLNDSLFHQSFRFGFLWTISVTVSQIVLGFGLALLLNKKIAFTAWTRVFMLVPWAMPPVIRGIMWRFMYHPHVGAVNHIFMRIGLIENPINWLHCFEHTIPAVIVVGIWGGLPQATVALLAGLQLIPPELYEAASIDGGNKWDKFRHITLPLIKPITVAISALLFMWNFNAFGLIFVLTGGGPAGTTRVPMLFAYEEGFKFGNMGYAAALGNVMVIIIGVIMFTYVRQQMKERA